MSAELIFLVGILVGICLGMIAVLAVNASWYRIAIKQNRDWAKHCKDQNEEWYALALKVSGVIRHTDGDKA